MTVTKVGTIEEMAAAAAERFVDICASAISARGKVSVALAGGNTPRRLNEILSSEPFLSRIEWDKITFLLGDERLVPVDDQDSNYRMIRESLLSHAPINPHNFLRVYTSLATPGAAAGDYELTLRKHLDESGGFPVIDLVLLGMGPDGHTASLFPGTEALRNNSNAVCANYVPKFGTWRITLTAPTLRAARNILFMAGGAEKAEALKEVLEGAENPSLYPAQLIRGMPGKVEWLVDSQISAGVKS